MSEILELGTDDTFDEALLGICRRFDQTFLVYDEEKVIEILARDMDLDDAREFFEFNVVGAWMGPGTPAFLDPGQGLDND